MNTEMCRGYGDMIKKKECGSNAEYCYCLPCLGERDSVNRKEGECVGALKMLRKMEDTIIKSCQVHDFVNEETEKIMEQRRRNRNDGH